MDDFTISASSRSTFIITFRFYIPSQVSNVQSNFHLSDFTLKEKKYCSNKLDFCAILHSTTTLFLCNLSRHTIPILIAFPFNIFHTKKLHWDLSGDSRNVLFGLIFIGYHNTIVCSHFDYLDRTELPEQASKLHY